MTVLAEFVILRVGDTPIGLTGWGFFWMFMFYLAIWFGGRR